MLYFGIRYTKCSGHPPCGEVILRVGMWIEMDVSMSNVSFSNVILRVRVWIEISLHIVMKYRNIRHPLREGVDGNHMTALDVLSVQG